MTTQLNSKLLTLNSNRKQKRTLRQKGFTLIELMVVTGIAGVLGAVAVPKFIGAQQIASTKAEIASAVGLAKECQTWVQTDGSSMAAAPTGCTTTGGGTFKSGAFKLPATLGQPITCLGTSVPAGTSGTVTITVAASSDATCAVTA